MLGVRLEEKLSSSDEGTSKIFRSVDFGSVEAFLSARCDRNASSPDEGPSNSAGFMGCNIVDGFVDVCLRVVMFSSSEDGTSKIPRFAAGSVELSQPLPCDGNLLLDLEGVSGLLKPSLQPPRGPFGRSWESRSSRTAKLELRAALP